MNNNNKVSFSELLLWNNKTPLEVSIICGKSERTINNWLKNNKPCKACYTLLLWLWYGMPQVETWIDWKLRNGTLISPGGFQFDSRHLEILPVLHQWRAEQEAEYNKIRFDAHKQIKDMSYFT